jgi:hypothetical protein
MTPVTGSVTDRKEYRPVFESRPFQRFCVPGIPIDRIMSMLEKVRGIFVDQVIGHARMIPFSPR